MTIIRRSDAHEPNAPVAGEQRPSGPQVWRNVFNSPAEAEDALGCWTPLMEVFQDKDGVRLELEMPGMDRDDIVVDIDGGILSVSGERKEPADSDGTRVIRTERCYGSFCRSFSLSNQIDGDGIEAHMDKGMLTLRLPFREDGKPRQIEVKP